MIAKDFKIDFEKKRIYHNPKGGSKSYAVNELYSFLQDTFDEPQNMKHDIPIEAKSKKKYYLINGWTIDKKDRKYLKEGTLVVFNVVTE